MRIIFIGTSHGVPAADRYCTCILIESGESFYFIDAGVPIADVIMRRGLDMHNFKAIFRLTSTVIIPRECFKLRILSTDITRIAPRTFSSRTANIPRRSRSLFTYLITKLHLPAHACAFPLQARV